MGTRQAISSILGFLLFLSFRKSSREIKKMFSISFFWPIRTCSYSRLMVSANQTSEHSGMINAFEPPTPSYLKVISLLSFGQSIGTAFFQCTCDMNVDKVKKKTLGYMAGTHIAD